jgi:hypothetical protein
MNIPFFPYSCWGLGPFFLSEIGHSKALWLRDPCSKTRTLVLKEELLREHVGPGAPHRKVPNHWRWEKRLGHVI